MTAGVYEQIKDVLSYLQLDRAVEVFATLTEQARNDWSHIEFLARLIAEQASATRNRRFAARLLYVRFPFRRTIAEYDFDFEPSIGRRLVDNVATLRFISEGRPIPFPGQPGCGNTHLAVAIATPAVEAGYRGYFTNAEEMVAHINQAVREGTLGAKLKTYTAPTILVIDDVGLLPLERGAASAFYEVINQRYENQRSTLVTTNKSLLDWGEILSSWPTEILAHHDTGASNGPTEGLNLCVKKVKRNGHGFRNFENYRLRVLLYAGGITRPDRLAPPRIRTRSPHSNA